MIPLRLSPEVYNRMMDEVSKRKKDERGYSVNQYLTEILLKDLEKNTVVKTYYLPHDGVELFTMAVLPSDKAKYPTVIIRSPYEAHHENLNDEELEECLKRTFKKWTENGYALVFQHCRGTGKSSGDSDAFIYEREEGLALQEWVRHQDFYNGEIFLTGGSYCGWASLSTAPFAPDIKGIILEATDCELYNFLYLNGFYRSRLHGEWYIDRYKKKGSLKKNFSADAFMTLPMTDYSKRVFGEPCPSLDEMLKHPDRDDPFYDTPMGGMYQRKAVREARIPMLITTGFFDIFSGGGHDVWESISPEIKDKCAFVVHPYHHGGNPDGQPYHFVNGQLDELMGDFEVKWFDHIRKGTAPPAPLGKITYYELFDNRWHTDGYTETSGSCTFVLGGGEKSYTYDPRDPATFEGGLSNNFGGTVFMDATDLREDIISCYTVPFKRDTHVRGKMTAKLCVKSDREDTCFYVRVGLVKKEGDFALRDSITKISNLCDNYIPGEELEIPFTFDTGAFMIGKGEMLRVDITSSAFPLFVPHTNKAGLFSVQTDAVAAHNTVDLSRSTLTVSFS